MSSSNVNALVLTGYGLNCDNETAYAFELAGAYGDLGEHVTGVCDPRYVVDLDDNKWLYLTYGLDSGEARIARLACPSEGISAYLDIKPGACPNPLNRHSHGMLTVAICGTPEFDVTQIDLESLVLTRADAVGGSVTPLMGPPGPRIRVHDVATPFEGEPCDCHNLHGNGIDDLVMKFETELLVAELQLDGMPAGTFVGLVLNGVLSDGTPFSATDCVLVRGGPDAPPAAAERTE